MSEYKILMGYVTHDYYKIYEDNEGHHAGEQVDTHTIDDPYYVVLEDGEQLEDFETYKEAKEYVEQLKKHGSYDYEYCDEKHMLELVKYDGYHDEWNCTNIYVDTAEQAKKLIEQLTAKDQHEDCN